MMRTPIRRTEIFRPIIQQMTRRHRVKVKRWRSNMSGCAWSVRHSDGRRINWIEAPFPKTPISLAVFLHEIGHHAIGFDKYERGCEEEYHVWMWAVATMRKLGIEPDARVLRRVEMSMRYAVEKAARHGMTQFPLALQAYAPTLPQAA
jgi:hypothetical protein